MTDATKRILAQGRMKKDIKLAARRGCDMDKLEAVLGLLKAGEALSEQYRDHPLTGEWTGYRDCHLAPDWVLIYKIDEDAVILARTGAHSDLFG